MVGVCLRCVPRRCLSVGDDLREGGGEVGVAFFVDVDDALVFFAVFLAYSFGEVCVEAVGVEAFDGVGVAEDCAAEGVEGADECVFPMEGDTVHVDLCGVCVVTNETYTVQ